MPGFGRRDVRSRSLAHVDPFGEPALVTQYVAAPVEAAVAALAASVSQDVVAATAAQRITRVHAGAALIANAALGPRRVHPGVSLAEVWRLFEVDQLSGEAATLSPAKLQTKCS